MPQTNKQGELTKRQIGVIPKELHAVFLGPRGKTVKKFALRLKLSKLHLSQKSNKVFGTAAHEYNLQKAEEVIAEWVRTKLPSTVHVPTTPPLPGNLTPPSPPSPHSYFSIPETPLKKMGKPREPITPYEEMPELNLGMSQEEFTRIQNERIHSVLDYMGFFD